MECSESTTNVQYDVSSSAEPPSPRSETSGSDDDYGGEKGILPAKRGNRFTRNLRFTLLSSYRKCFAVIFTVNMAVLLTLAAKASGVPASSRVGEAAGANLMVCVLFRQEDFINLLYKIFCSAPRSLPLWIRRRLAKVHYYGGCHSGCAVAAVFWYLFYTVLVTRDYIDRQRGDILANMICSWILVAVFVLILTTAYPTIRVRFHDTFEAIHRFAGWTVLIVFWIQTGLASRATAPQTSRPVGLVLIASPNFWFILIATGVILLSWVRGYPLHDVLYTARLFKRIVVVATGSGIGPCLSLFIANVAPCRVLWSTRDPYNTYGAGVVDAVLRTDPEANIWDTTRTGYPDMVKETWRLVEAFDAEAVYIVSNPKLTRQVLYGMRTRGISAFGPVFDS